MNHDPDEWAQHYLGITITDRSRPNPANTRMAHITKTMSSPRPVRTNPLDKRMNWLHRGNKRLGVTLSLVELALETIEVGLADQPVRAAVVAKYLSEVPGYCTSTRMEEVTAFLDRLTAELPEWRKKYPWDKHLPHLAVLMSRDANFNSWMTYDAPSSFLPWLGRRPGGASATVTLAKWEAHIRTAPAEQVYTFSDGWRVWRLSAENLAYEGMAMKNCLANASYIRDGWFVWSLRNPAGQPRVSLAVSPNFQERADQFEVTWPESWEIMGRSNTRPGKYQQRIREFLAFYLEGLLGPLDVGGLRAAVQRIMEEHVL